MTWVLTIVATVVIVVVIRAARRHRLARLGGRARAAARRRARQPHRPAGSASPGSARGHVVDFIAYGGLVRRQRRRHRDRRGRGPDRGPGRPLGIGLDGTRDSREARSDADRRAGRGRRATPTDSTGTTTSTEQRCLTTRALPVPDGLAGERVDAGAVAAARALAHPRGRARRGRRRARSTAGAVGKSDRLAAGRLARGRDPGRGAARPPSRSSPSPSRACGSCTTTTTSWSSTSPSASPRTRRRAGPGRPSSARWPPPATGSRRRGPPSGRAIVHRLDVGTSGLMVVAKSEHAYTVLKRAFKERTVEKVYHALVQGHPEPTTGTIDAPDRPAPDRRLEVRGRRRRQAVGDALRGARDAARRRRWSRCTSRPAARTRSACTSRRCGTRASATSPTARTRRSRPALGLTRQWLHAVRLGFEHPGDGRVARADERVPGGPRARRSRCSATGTLTLTALTRVRRRSVGTSGDAVATRRECRRGDLGSPAWHLLEAPTSSTCTSHTEYSMLDGAARIGRPVRRGRAAGPDRDGDHRPRLPVRRVRVLEARRASHGHQADHRRRGVRHAGHQPVRPDPGPLGRGAPGGGRRLGARRVHPHDAAGPRRPQGMHNLFRMGSLASLEGQIGKWPRMDRELLQHVRRGPDRAPPAARPARCRPGCGWASTTRPCGPRASSRTSSARRTSTSS